MLTARQFEILGKEVFKRNPGFAREIIKDLNIYPAISSLETLPLILADFCRIQGVTPEELRERKNWRKTETVAKKTMFCAVAVLIFQPQNLKELKEKNRYGLRNLIAKELNTTSQNALKLISKARFYFQNYKDFRASVLSAYSQIIEKYVIGDN